MNMVLQDDGVTLRHIYRPKVSCTLFDYYVPSKIFCVGCIGQVTLVSGDALILYPSNAQQPKNLRCQLQNGMIKNLVIEEVSPSTTFGILISWVCLKNNLYTW
jgi:hypothetical protein